MNRLRRLSRPMLHLILLSFCSMSLYVPVSQASIIGTGQVVEQQQRQQLRADNINQITRVLEQENVKQRLASLGVDKADLQSRIENLSDNELAMMADRLDQLPAGQGIEGAIVFIFLVLLLTDILGLTDVFPFVKKH